MKIKPLFNRRVVEYLKRDSPLILAEFEDGREVAIDLVRRAIDQLNGDRLLCVSDGIPIPDNMHIVEPTSVVAINGKLQPPYCCVAPTGTFQTKLIYVPDTVWSGWYDVLATYTGEYVGKRCLIFYNAPTLPMADGSEYCSLDQIALVEE